MYIAPENEYHNVIALLVITALHACITFERRYQQELLYFSLSLDGKLLRSEFVFKLRHQRSFLNYVTNLNYVTILRGARF